MTHFSLDRGHNSRHLPRIVRQPERYLAHLALARHAVHFSLPPSQRTKPALPCRQRRRVAERGGEVLVSRVEVLPDQRVPPGLRPNLHRILLHLRRGVRRQGTRRGASRRHGDQQGHRRLLRPPLRLLPDRLRSDVRCIQGIASFPGSARLFAGRRGLLLCKFRRTAIRRTARRCRNPRMNIIEMVPPRQRRFRGKKGLLRGSNRPLSGIGDDFCDFELADPVLSGIGDAFRGRCPTARAAPARPGTHPDPARSAAARRCRASSG